ncbi:MAG: carbohydrate ABC transporter permease [Athalassotoga sp.]|uniref:carbohydrate ABC transporter permease n=1 Tax=Athalassotoga sp. TaxID=2022597 RepID=UPI00175B4A5A|nr:carbohydrate ABC transporter permease [Mesoaciditoga lauensis]
MKRKNKCLSKIILYLLLVILTILAFAPILWMTVSAFKPEGEIASYPPTWIPEHPTLSNFSYVLGTFNFLRWTLNSFLAAIIATIIVILIDSMAAFSFARFHFKGNALLYATVLSMLMVPIQVTIIPLYLMFAHVHLLNTITSLILPTTGNVTGVFILRNFFRSVPQDLIDAARIDGAGYFRIWWTIMLPIARPSISAVAIITFISNWTNFLWPLVSVNSDASRTLPVGIAEFFGGQSGVSGSAPQYGPAMAAALMATIPAIVIFLLLQRYFVKGITMTGIKG